MVQNRIISWYLKNKRTLPWRKTGNPYFIWISEIILQQTRVAQGLPYYEKFTQKYPTVFDLARAPEAEVLRLWQGLGYYSRGRNMHATAQYIVSELKGKFPQTYEALLGLKGVGSYTAAAVASFAFKERVPAIDGNVIRVISRLFKIEKPVDRPEALAEIREISEALISTVQPDLYNQAMMELGAMVCTAKKPNCKDCPAQPHCLSYPEGDFNRIPFKAKKTKVQERSMHYILVVHGGKMRMKKRIDNDIWRNLYDFPELPPTHIEDFLTKVNAQEVVHYPPVIHLLSHRKLSVHFTYCTVATSDIPLEGNWFSFEEVEQLAKPQIIVGFLAQLDFFHA